MYRAFGLLQPQSDFTLDELHTRLAAKFPSAAIGRNGDQICAAIDGWDVNFFLNQDAEVLTESNLLAEKIAGLEDGVDLESCAARVEAWSETPDPMLEHFEKYQKVIEVLQSFRGLIALDPKEPALL
jgi:hypothetical protein